MKKLIIAASIVLASFSAQAETYSLKCENSQGSVDVHFNDVIAVADLTSYRINKEDSSERSTVYSRKTPSGKLISSVIITPATDDVYLVSFTSTMQSYECSFQ